MFSNPFAPKQADNLPRELFSLTMILHRLRLTTVVFPFCLCQALFQSIKEEAWLEMHEKMKDITRKIEVKRAGQRVAGLAFFSSQDGTRPGLQEEFGPAGMCEDRPRSSCHGIPFSIHAEVYCVRLSVVLQQYRCDFVEPETPFLRCLSHMNMGSCHSARIACRTWNVAHLLVVLVQIDINAVLLARFVFLRFR